MSNLQINNSFEPYYAGRDTDACKWTVHKKNRDRTDEVKVEHCEEEAKSPKRNTKTGD